MVEDDQEKRNSLLGGIRPIRSHHVEHDDIRDNEHVSQEEHGNSIEGEARKNWSLRVLRKLVSRLFSSSRIFVE